MPRCLIATVVMTSLLGSGVSAAQTLAVDPPRPTPDDPISLRIEYESHNCLVDSTVDSFGRTLLLTAIENCLCDQLVGPNSFEAAIGPLGAGVWHVEFTVVNDSGSCQDAQPPLFEEDFLVQHRPTFVDLTLEPAAPVAGEPVAIVVESLCPFAWDESVAIAGRVVEVTEVPSLQLAPCLEEGGYLNRVELGVLTDGPFTALFVSDAGGEAPELILPFEFEIAKSTVAEARMQRDRFVATARWSTPDGESGDARSTSGSRGDSDELWFFDAENVEVMVKVLDGCGINGHHWVFAAGLTDLGVELQVSDTQTGRVKEYSTLAGEPFGTIRDTAAFPCADA